MVFPRAGQKSADPNRVAPDELNTKIHEINKRIAKLDDGKMVKYLDIGPKFLDKEGGLTKEVMPDYLHLSRKGYRLWSPSRVSLVKKMILEGRLHKRTVVHREPSNRPEVVSEFAREVNQFLRDGKIDVESFLRELGRLNAGVGQRVNLRRPASGARGSKTA